MYVDNSGIDGGGSRQKTRRVPLTPAERSRVGLLLKGRREDRELKQHHIAKQIDCSVGTVQAIEYNKYRVDRETVEKYAAVFGTTVDELLHPGSTFPAANALAADLNREHLAIARGYMRAVKAVRNAIEHLLTDTKPAEITEEIADVVNVLKTMADHEPQIAYWTLFILDRGFLMQAIAQRIDRDPMFEERLRDLLNEPYNSPTPDAPKRMPRSPKNKTK